MIRSQLIAALFCLSLLSSTLLSQQQQSQPPTPNALLELPDFLVTGKAVVDIAAGSKQAPQKPFRLSTGVLDSLNPTEKFPAPNVPNRPLPQFTRDHIVRNTYVDASFGSYTTPTLMAGHSFRSGDYHIDASVDGLYSKDWAPNASLLTAGVGLTSSYLAPEKFYLFGKGLTETDVRYRHSQYTLFADSSAPERKTSNFFAGLTTEAFVNDLRYTADIYWNAFNVDDQRSGQIRDQRLHANLHIPVDRLYAVSSSIHLQGRDDVSYPYIDVGLTRFFGDSLLHFETKLGAQYATSTVSEARVGVSIDADLFYQVNEHISIAGQLQSGLRAQSFTEFALQNPYVHSLTLLDLPYDLARFDVRLKYHPDESLQMLVKLSGRSTLRNPMWVDTTTALLDLVYRDVIGMSAAVEVHYQPSMNDRFVGSAFLQSVTLEDGNSATYTEPFRLDAAYQRQIGSSLHVRVAGQYVGKRYADVANSLQIDAYLNLQFTAKYAIRGGLDVVFTADNLINSTIILWNGYRERSIFVAGGVSWRL